jgi:hypothetical protein
MEYLKERFDHLAQKKTDTFPVQLAKYPFFVR